MVKNSKKGLNYKKLQKWAKQLKWRSKIRTIIIKKNQQKTLEMIINDETE